MLCFTEGELRLLGGTGGMSGRVEIYHNNRWGTVCSKGWDEQVIVACEFLEFRLWVNTIFIDNMNGKISVMAKL